MKFRICSILAICVLAVLAQPSWIPFEVTPIVEAQTQSKDESVLVAESPIAATITAQKTKLAVKGKLSLQLEVSPDDLKRGVVTVKAFNLAFFGVQQSALSGKETAVKQGVLGMTLPPSERSVQLRYDSRTQTVSGDVPVQAHYPQLDEIFPPEIFKGNDRENDFAVSRTQRGKVRIQMKFAEALDKSAVTAAKATKASRLTVDVAKTQIEIESLEDRLPGYRLDISDWRLAIEIAPYFRFEVAQSLCIQPVRIRNSKVDLSPTGAGLAFGMPGANTQWAKADVVFQVRSWMVVTNASVKVASEGAEETTIRNSVSVDDCIEVFFVQNFDPVDLHGGGATWSSGTANAKIITSDGNAVGGIDLTHLAHELGHVLNLCHPGSPCGLAASSTNTLMCPSGWRRDNPARNSQDNKNNISNPLLRFSIKLKSAGPDCTSSADCGACP